jgi:glucose-1-phosphate thymidylyltransferase
LLPDGGKAKRVEPLPCSKEIYPIGFHRGTKKLAKPPKVVSHYLFDKMRLANVTKAFIVLRSGKWDIPSYYGSGKLLLNSGYPLFFSGVFEVKLDYALQVAACH